MQLLKNPLMRTWLLLGVTVGLVTVSTYATLQSSGVLTGNTISSGTVNLEVSTDGVVFSSSQPGLDFEVVVPGGDPEPNPAHSFWLRNTGSTAVGLSAGVAPGPNATITPSGSIDFTKVILEFTRAGTAATFDHSLQDLLDNHASGGVTLGQSVPENGTPIEFNIQARILPEAFTGSHASITDIDITFFGLHSID